MDLHDLVAPPPAADFRERLWERAEEWQRRRALRWRLTALAATAIAVAAVSAAGVTAFATQTGGPAVFDETLRCTVPVHAGVPILNLQAVPKGWYFAKGKKIPRPATLFLGTDSIIGPGDVGFLSFTSAARGFGSLHSTACTPAPSIPLSPSGLPAYDAVTGPSDGVVNAVNVTCFSATTIVAHQHVRIEHGAPVAGQVAIRSGKRQRPFMYVDWAPNKVTVYASAQDCHQ